MNPPRAMDMSPPIRLGLGRRMQIAFALAAAITGFLAISALWIFRDVDASLRVLQEQNLPAELHVAELNASAHALSASLAALAMADRPTDKVPAQQQIDQLLTTIDQQIGLVLTSEREARIQLERLIRTMRLNANNTRQLVDGRADLYVRRQVKLDAIEQAAAVIRQQLLVTTGSPAQIMQLSGELGQLSGLLSAASQAQDEQQLAMYHDAYTPHLQRLQYLVHSLPATRQQVVRTALAPFEEAIVPGDGLIALYGLRLGLDRITLQLLQENQQLTQEISSLLTHVASDNRQDTVALLDDRRYVLQRGSVQFGVILLVALALFFWVGYVYVGRVIMRLERLQQGVQDIVTGRTTGSLVMQDAEDDEILALSNSLDRFRDLIQQLREQSEGLARSEARLWSIFEASPFPLWISNLETGYLIYLDHRFAELFKLGQERGGSGLDISQLFAERGAYAELQCLMNTQHRISDRELQLRAVDGTLVWVMLSAVRIQYADQQAIFGALQDISGRKQAEEQQRRAKESAEAATRAKSAFLANMSHELRTPLAAILGYAHLMQQTSLTQRQQSLQQKVSASATTLLELIDSILDFSKIEAGRLELESVDFNLQQVLDRVASIATVQAEAKGLSLVIAVDPSVPMALKGDPLRLGQILLNLVNNAIKFTLRGKVMVTVVPGESTDQQVELQCCVKDTGIGMSEAQMATIFQSFTQADSSTTRRFGGTGLGLAICRELIHKMEGEIDVSSLLGQGTLFSFNVWLQRATLQSAASDDGHGLHGLTAMVVDHNVATGRELADWLSGWGMKVRHVSSGEIALQLLLAAQESIALSPVDLVLIEQSLPALDGVDTARKLAQQMRSGRLVCPKVMLLVSNPLAANAGNPEGVDATLQKPVGQAELQSMVMQVLGQLSSRPVSPPCRATLRAELRGMRILVVEDNDILCEFEVDLLSSMGVLPIVAVNGKQAVDLLADPETHVDAVLMDVQMPIMDGLAATRLIRRLPGREQLPIIAMTAHAIDTEKQRCFDAGMNDHISKPIDPDRLAGALVHAVYPSVAAGSVPMPTHLPDVPDLPGLDLNAALQRLGGKVAFLRRMLNRFRTGYPDAAHRLRELSDSVQYDEARRYAHSLKGLAGTLGATQVAELASMIEPKMAQHSSDGMDQLLIDLAAELDVVLNSIDSWLPPRSEMPVKSDHALDGRDDAAPQLNELDALLRVRSISARRRFQELQALVAAVDESVAIDMGTALESLDFPEAQRLLGRILAYYAERNPSS
ncbi:PAS domain S-box-containing protein [Chitinivorax tropicus]|uniref:Sensory/regulatory protein RpfC n=1 Tax=Chitinivorax tropicus TaxID=714531 RepID=A0A840MBY0_9PROT|nr:PAS domain S-box-containing protein [Chitinivorax tropicus]